MSQANAEQRATHQRQYELVRSLQNKKDMVCHRLEEALIIGGDCEEELANFKAVVRRLQVECAVLHALLTRYKREDIHICWIVQEHRPHEQPTPVGQLTMAEFRYMNTAIQRVLGGEQ